MESPWRETRAWSKPSSYFRRVLQNQSVWPVQNDQTDETESKSESSESKPESSESKSNNHNMVADLKLEISEKSNLKELKNFIKKHNLNVKYGRQHSKRSNWPQIYKKFYGTQFD